MYGSEVNVILGKFVLSIVLIQHSGYLSDIFSALCCYVPIVRILCENKSTV
jgi:hypothetical protein